MGRNNKQGIAIIGMSCRFPGSDNPEEFWKLIAAGQNQFSDIPYHRQKKYDFSILKTKQGSFLDRPFDFDNDYFKITEADAMAMDPQQRIILELALEAKEHAFIKEFTDKNVGVFIGANQQSYVDGIISKSYGNQFLDKIKRLDFFNELTGELKERLLDEISALSGNEKLSANIFTGNLSNLISGRVSHHFNLKGPSLTMDTACSSSLVAVHMACESLYNKECNLAYAGGINLNLTPTIFSLMEETGAISPSGKSIPFSDQSDGTILGEGGGLVLLKRLDEAIEDGDNILSVIRASGVNNDGRSLGIMAPSWKGQLELLESVYTNYGFDRKKIDLMEAHGTSTRIGDAVEMTVLERFFKEKTTPLSVGSIKSNIGHTMAASGIAGLIKVVMAIRAKKIPPTLFGNKVNPKWKLKENSIFVQNELTDWESSNLRSAGVSSFGFGGTNAHLIVEELNASFAKANNRNPKYTKLKRKTFEFDFHTSRTLENESVFSLHWERTTLKETASNFKPDLWLLFSDKNKISLQEQLLQNNVPCITILPGKHFTRADDFDYTIDYGNIKHLKWLMKELRDYQTIGVIYSPLSNENEHAQRTYEEMLFTRRLIIESINSQADLRLWCLSSNAYKVLDQEMVSPHEHAILTLFSSALNENSQLRGGIINVKIENDADLALVPKLLRSELKAPVIIRNREYYSPKLKAANLHLGSSKNNEFADDGVYLIIGASSGIGEEIAKHISNSYKAKIIITGTRPEHKLSSAIKSLIGKYVEYIQSSILDRTQTIELVQSIFKKYKKLNAVFVSAGANSIGSFKSMSDVDFERVIKVKLMGVENLHAAIKEFSVDFVYLLSSASSLSPSWSFGMSAYAASNAYVNAFAESRGSSKTSWKSRSWSIWEGIGMSKGIDTSHFKSMQAFTKMEAIKLLEYSMQSEEANLAVLHAQDGSAFSIQWSTKIQQVSKKKHGNDGMHKNPKVSNEPENFEKDSSSLERGEAANLNTAEIYQNQSFSGPSYQASPASELQHHGSANTKAAISMKSYLKTLIAIEIDIAVESVDETESFNNLGLDSISALDIIGKIEKEYTLNLNPTLLFEYDTIASLAQYFDQLNGNTETEPATQFKNIGQAEYALLPTQKTFYSNQQFYPELPCNCLVKISFAKLFNYTLLSRAWDLVIEQNQSLKLVFEMTKEGPVQAISDGQSHRIERYKLGDENKSMAGVAEIENRMINKVYPFDGRAMFDLSYIETTDSKAVLIFNAHHIITDAWSMNLVLNQLIEKYTEFESDIVVVRPRKKHSFLDYVDHKIKKQVSKEMAKKITVSSAYWSKELEDFVPFDLPAKTVLNCVAGIKHDVHNIILSRDISQQIENKARVENVTLFQLLISSYFMVVARFSGQNDLVINLASDNRDRAFANINHIAGCIADSKPLRIKIQANDHLLSISKKVKTKLTAHGNFNSLSSIDYASLKNMRSEMGPKGITPFGMSYLNLDYFKNNDLLKEATIEARSALPFTDLSLICLKQKGRLHISWNYSATSFTQEYIKEINAAFLAFLAGEEDSGTVPPPLEIDPLVLPSSTLFPSHSLLHEKVFAACDIFQNDKAICESDQTLSYGELKCKSIQIANALIHSKNNEAEVIGILEYPGVNAACGILGILASNCAYIPLDPDWPHQRIEMIVKHSEMEVLITSRRHFESIKQNEKILEKLKSVVFLDDEVAKEKIYKGLNILDFHGASATILSKNEKVDLQDALAYVMYTSGTTGKPKGVSVRHSSVAIFLSWISEEFKISSKDRFIATSSLGFGGSIRQMFSTLLAGGEIYPIDRYDFKDPKSLLDYIEEHKITIFNTVPSVLQNICDYMKLLGESEPEPDLSMLRLILVGGEILHAKTIHAWRNYFGNGQQIFNLYGSTETIVNATFHEVKKEKTIPIGKTRNGSHVLLLNEHGKVCEPNEKGELLVGGPSLASGYYKDEITTKKKFVPLDIKGAKGVYYHTGDLATRDSLGIYHYLGRNDNQIQLYGNRIEPSEIESIIVELEGISKAVVVDHKSNNAHYLIAFIECSKENKNSHTEVGIRTIIGERLPQYMVPHKIKFVDPIPLNHAGKIDRVELSADINTEIEDFGSSDTKEIIHSIWKKALRINDIDFNDDFFKIGGDSILALQVLHSLRKKFQIAPKPVELFRKRTINQLSICIDQLNGINGLSCNMDLPRENETHKPENATKFQLSTSQKGFLFLNKIDPLASPNLVALLPIHGAINYAVFKIAFNYLMDRHPILRTSFTAEETNAVQKVISDCQVEIDFNDISSESDNQQKNSIDEVFEKFKGLKFDLRKPPLFKLELVKLSQTSSVLIVAMHHIIGDAWSLKILMNELLKSYDLKLINKEALLPAPSSSFLDFVHYETSRNRMSNTRMNVLNTFWNNAFQELPFNQWKDLSEHGQSTQVVFKLSSHQRAQLKAFSLRNGFSLFQLIFTAYARTLHQLLNVKAVLINTAISGREAPVKEIERIIGCFARNVAVRIDASDLEFIDDVKRVKETFLKTVDHQDIPPSKLIKLLIDHKHKLSALSQFVMSYMDFNSTEEYTSSNFSFDLNEADFYFNADSASSDIMLSTRVVEDVTISINGRANLDMKNRVMDGVRAELIGLINDDEFLDASGLRKRPHEINAALIAYLPSKESLTSFLTMANKSNEVINAFIESLFPNGKPRLLEIEKTIYGHAGIVFLPYAADDLFQLGKDKFLDLMMEALLVASNHGAKNISLAGNLASRTNYAFSVLEKLAASKAHDKEISITTGHSCTVVSVVKTIEKLVTELDLDIQNLTVGVAGYGSIGQASLDLLIDKLGVPKKIIIADLAHQIPQLNDKIEGLKKRYRNTIEIIGVADAIPKEFYEAQLMIGSSSKGKILKVDHFLPGTILADDSFPHIVDTKDAIKRMKDRKDILIVGAGKINVGPNERTFVDLPFSDEMIRKILKKFGDEGLPGCLAESVLMSYDKALPSTIGLVTTRNAQKYWDRMTVLNIDSVSFHLEGFEVGRSLMEGLKKVHDQWEN